jgi:hypothetical protein
MSAEEFNALPTPRTDAFYWKRRGINPETRHANEWQEFARQLEREVALLERALRLIWRDEGTTEAGCLAEETLRTLAEVRNTK